MKTYIITEQALQAFKDVIETGTSEILEPSTGELRLIVLRMMEKGLDMIDVIKKQEVKETEGVLNNWQQSEQEMIENNSHEAGQFKV